MVGTKPDGSPDVRQVYATTERECQRKLDDIRAKAAGGTLLPAEKERDTVGAYLNRWAEGTKASVRPKTHKRYAVIVRLHLVPGLGRHRLGKLTADHIDAFYARMLEATDPETKAKRWSRRTVHHCHRVLHRALEMAVKKRVLTYNPCEAVEAPTVPKREIVPPTPEEVAQLIDAAEGAADPLMGLWAMAAYTGARQAELLGLKWSDVDLDAGTLRIRRSLLSVKAGVPTFGEPKTAKSRRTVDLSPDAVAALRAHKDRQAWQRQALGDAYAPYDLVFATQLGTALLAADVSHKFKRALKRAGLRADIRFHDLRHGAITMMLQAGEPVATVSEMVGHHSPAMTYGVYGHVIPGTKR
jgi:integrase